MRKGPGDSLSGWPLCSDMDHAYHRATGAQIAKDEPVMSILAFYSGDANWAAHLEDRRFYVIEDCGNQYTGGQDFG